MKLAFITDLHIDKAFEYPHGIDCRENFQRILKAIAKTDAQALIIGGDLCYRSPEEEIYQWIFQELNNFGMPFHIIAGNHDNAVMMSTIGGFDALVNGTELYYARKFNHHLAIFLDTALGSISKNQFNWLDRQLHQHKGPVLIFMHHPPIAAGVPYMDNKHGFNGGEQLMELFYKQQQSISIFTGHYHVEKIVVKRNVQLIITPSCFFQIDQYREEFKVDHHRIAYRILSLDQDGFKSSLHYLAGSRQMEG